MTVTQRNRILAADIAQRILDDLKALPWKQPFTERGEVLQIMDALTVMDLVFLTSQRWEESLTEELVGAKHKS